MGTRWARFARGWAVALFSTLVAAGSHVAAGGGMPHLASLALALAFAGIVSIALTARRLSTARTAVSVVVSQAVFHGLFATIGGANGTVTGDGHHRGIVIAAGASAAAVTLSLGMLLAHAVAAVLTIAALRGAGSVFWGLADLVARFVRTLLPDASPAPIATAAPRHPVSRADAPSFALLLVSSLRYRGPPVAVAA